jgi:hypothetical protein
MRLARWLLVIFAVPLSACSSDVPQTTRGNLSPEEVSNLEIMAATRDPVALRDLNTFYDMEGRTADSERIHRQRLAINDPEAVRLQVYRDIAYLDRVESCTDKRALLEGARARAIASGASLGIANPQDDGLVRRISVRIAELRC